VSVITSATKSLGIAANVSEWITTQSEYHVDMKNSGLSCEDAQDKDDWRLRITGSTG